MKSRQSSVKSGAGMEDIALALAQLREDYRLVTAVSVSAFDSRPCNQN